MEKTAVDKLMMFLPIILVVVIAIVMIIKFIKKKYNPQSELISLKELKKYYIKSFIVIRNNKYLILIPLILISVEIVFGLIAQIRFYLYMLKNSNDPGSFNLFNFSLINIINYALSSLYYGIKQVFTSSTIFTLISVISIFLYPKFLKLLRSKTLGQRFPEYPLFKKVMILNVCIVILEILFYALLQSQYNSLGSSMLRPFIRISVEAMLKFFILSNYSFAIIIVLQYILDKINEIKRNRAGYLEIAINKFPLMFSFNLLLYLVIPYMISLTDVFFNLNYTTNNILNYLNNLIWLLMFVAPFLIINNKLRFSDVLENSLSLFFRNYRIPQFILSGLLGGAVLNIITTFFKNLWSSLLLNNVIGSFQPLFTIVYSMFFIVAFFIFMKDEVGKE